MTDTAIKNLQARLEQVSSRLATVEKQLASGGGAAAPAAGGGGGAVSDSKSLADYDALKSQYIDQYVELSAKINPIVKQQADIVAQAVSAQRQFLQVAAQSKKPGDSVFQQLFKPTSDLLAQIIELRDKNRAHTHFNHLSALSEGITALTWVAVSPTPGPFVDESRASSEFYSNKLLMQYRHDQSELGKTNVAWVSAWNTFLKELRQWIKNYHTTGLTWNPQGGDASAASAAPASAPAPSGGAPPPPGPPPPAMDFTSAPPPSSNAHAALFAEINAVKERQKGGKTEGLRTVTKEMKTKNQDKSALPVVVPKTPAGSAAPKKTTQAPARPPKFALEGNKWCVEHQVGNRELVIDNPEVRQTVYIYKCEDSVVQIKGKINAVTMDSCKKVGLVFDNAISVVEVVNCNSVQVQINGKVPSVLIDKSSGAQVFLSNEGLDTEIVTSKSDEMNVVLPPLNPTDDITEIAIPEQFKTVVKNRKLVTECVQHV